MIRQISATEADIAWAAGLFEGEGNIGHDRKASPGFRARLEPRLQIRMTDEDVVRRFGSIMGGRVTGPYRQKSPPDAKDYWIWMVSSWDEFMRIGALLRPQLGKRRGARFDFCLERRPNHFRKPLAFKPCDHPPTASLAGYLKHRRKGERACDTCMKSARLYYADYLPKWRAARAQKLADSSS